MTRFNMPTPGRESAIRNRPGWLAGRFELFERYCLPSVAAQSEQDFRWIIYFDAETPPEFRARIEELRRIRAFVPFYSGLFPSEGWCQSIDGSFARTPWLLTSQLDNDDALSSDHVARLQDAVRAELAAGRHERLLFNFTNGHVRRGPALYRLRHRKNPFFAHLEPWGDRTRPALSILHMALPRMGEVRQLPGPGAWMQVVHRTNVSNRARGWRIAPAGIEGRYPAALTAGIQPPGALEFVTQNLILGPGRRLRDALSAMVPRSTG